MHPDIGRPLSFMVSQSKWPVVRSEGWFVFALMAHFPEGAQCISDMMQDVAVFQPLVELLTGKNLVDYKSSSSSTTVSPSASGSASESSPSMTIGSSQTPESVPPHAQADEMTRLDRENALVLVNELLKNRGSEMAIMRRAMFEDLLQGGGELVMSWREGKLGVGGRELLSREDRGRAGLRAGLNLQEVSVESFKELM